MKELAHTGSALVDPRDNSIRYKSLYEKIILCTGFLRCYQNIRISWVWHNFLQGIICSWYHLLLVLFVTSLFMGNTLSVIRFHAKPRGMLLTAGASVNQFPVRQ